MWEKLTWNETTSCPEWLFHEGHSSHCALCHCPARTGWEVRVWLCAWKTTCALELGQVVLQGSEAAGHKCCCYSCFLWSFSFIRVAFLLSQEKIRQQRLEPGSHYSLVSPHREWFISAKSLTRGLNHTKKKIAVNKIFSNCSLELLIANSSRRKMTSFPEIWAAWPGSVCALVNWLNSWTALSPFRSPFWVEKILSCSVCVVQLQILTSTNRCWP